MQGSERRKALARILSELSEGTVIVEGRHDVEALADLGIEAIPEGSVRRKGLNSKKKIFILMDNDRRGAERTERLIGTLLESSSPYVIDQGLGLRLQRMLNITSIEQMRAPVHEALKG